MNLGLCEESAVLFVTTREIDKIKLHWHENKRERERRGLVAESYSSISFL